MIFVIDIGNTNIVLGVYQGKDLLHLWRISTDIRKTSEEYLIAIHNLFRIHSLDPRDVECTVMGSVVSPLDSIFRKVVKTLTNKEIHLVDLTCFPHMPILMDKPEEVGADRLLNASAGFHNYGGPLIIIDFGTATTFDVVSANGEYLGGIIATGLVLSLEALTAKAFKLPKIDLVQPKSVIGKNTAHAMRSGIVFGYAGMVDSLVAKISEELGAQPRVIATGGLASLIKPVSATIEVVSDDLTLKGLYMISQSLVT